MCLKVQREIHESEIGKVSKKKLLSTSRWALYCAMKVVFNLI